MKPELAMPDNMMVVQGTIITATATNETEKSTYLLGPDTQDDDDNNNLPGCNWSVQ